MHDGETRCHGAGRIDGNVEARDRLNTSMARVSHGRPIGSPVNVVNQFDIELRVVNLNGGIRPVGYRGGIRR
jgi:hypothetical protein